jgi:hypothetical protein
MCHWVWSRNLKNVATLACVGLLRQRKMNEHDVRNDPGIKSGGSKIWWAFSDRSKRNEWKSRYPPPRWSYFKLRGIAAYEHTHTHTHTRVIMLLPMCVSLPLSSELTDLKMFFFFFCCWLVIMLPSPSPLLTTCTHLFKKTTYFLNCLTFLQGNLKWSIKCGPSCTRSPFCRSLYLPLYHGLWR